MVTKKATKRVHPALTDAKRVGGIVSPRLESMWRETDEGSRSPFFDPPYTLKSPDDQGMEF